MAITHEIGDEPVPGYRLLKRLGAGAFGEVWQATAPGGTEVALKFIQLDGDHGIREVKSLELVKTIRHPNLCTIFALWARDTEGGLIEPEQVDLKQISETKRSAAPTDETLLAPEDLSERPAELVIAMGLGEKTLADRLNECRAEGQQGVPPEELFEYMEASARAIDHLNSPRHDLGEGPQAIQHCDIKPQNILIVGDTAQVCDFGIARKLGNRQMTQQGGLSLYWAAPELFDKRPSKSTDQYSLALTYYHARTGKLPFHDSENATELQIMRAHTAGLLDLSAVPEDEQAVLRRATALDPEARYEKTLDLARALRRAYEGAAHSMPSHPVALATTGMKFPPGYELVRRIWGGGGVDMWQATDSEGASCAILLRDVAGQGVTIDLDALALVQRLRHPRWTPLRAVWLLDSGHQLIPEKQHPEAVTEGRAATLAVATELAPKNLLQRLEECRRTTGPGIPDGELLDHLRALAEALDALQSPDPQIAPQGVRLAHCNLRPTTVLLTPQGAKLSYFGLTRFVPDDGQLTSRLGSTAEQPFAAPELSDGVLTPLSDQYSLAITYVQLRTGNSPFDAAASTESLAVKKRKGLLRLDDLTPAEAEVVGRATNVVPERRFATCGEFVAAIAEARQRDRAAATHVGEVAGGTQVGTTPGSDFSFDPADSRTEIYVEPRGDDTVRNATIAGDTDRTAVSQTAVEPLSPEIATGRQRRWVNRYTTGAAVFLLGVLFAAGWIAQRGAARFERQVDRLIAERQYVEADQLVQAVGALTSRFVSRGRLEQKVVAAAISDTQRTLEKEGFLAALDPYLQAFEIAPARAQEQVGGELRTAGLQASDQAMTRERYAEAASIQAQLVAVFPREVSVVDRSRQVLKRGATRAQELLDEPPVTATTLRRVADWYGALDQLAAGLRQHAPEMSELAALENSVRFIGGLIVRRGDETVRTSVAQGALGEAVQAVLALQTNFAQDSLVEPLDELVSDDGTRRAADLLDAGDYAAACQLYGQLVPLEPGQAAIRALRDRLLDNYRAQLAARAWNDAAANCRALADAAGSGSTREAVVNELFDSAGQSIVSSAEAGRFDDAESVRLALLDQFADHPRFAGLQTTLIEAASRFIDERLSANQIREAATAFYWLQGRFAEDPAVEALAASLAERVPNFASMATAPERVGQLIAEAHGLVDQARLEEAEDQASQAAELAASLSSNAELAARLQLLDARLRAAAGDDEAATQSLAEVDVDALATAADRGLYRLLSVLSSAEVVALADESQSALPAVAAIEPLLAYQEDIDAASIYRREMRQIDETVSQLTRRLIADLWAGDSVTDADRQQFERARALIELVAAGPRRALEAEFGPLGASLVVRDIEASWEEIGQALQSLETAPNNLAELPEQALLKLVDALVARAQQDATPDGLVATAEFVASVRASRPALGGELDRAYAGLRAAEIHIAASSDEPPNWLELAAQCQAVADELQGASAEAELAFITTCRAECLFEASLAGNAPGESRRQASQLLDRAIRWVDDDSLRSYWNYVSILASVRPTGSPPDASVARQVHELYSLDAYSPLLDKPYRAARAAGVLLAASTDASGWDDAQPSTLDVLSDPPRVASTAATIFPWLMLSRELFTQVGGEPAPVLLLNLAAAAAYKEEPQGELATKLTTALIDAGVDGAELRLVRAGALRATDPSAALLDYAAALERVAARPEYLRAATYRRILAPALDDDPPLEPAADDTTARAALARLWAAKAQLVLVEPETSRMFEDPKQTAFEAYDAAVQFDPNNDDYRLRRGLVRLDRPDRESDDLSADLEAVRGEDLAPVLGESRVDEGEFDHAVALFLRGRANFVASRRAGAEGDRAERNRLLRLALGDYERAVTLDQLRGDDLANCLIGASTANVALANYTADDRQSQRDYLGRAKQWSTQATTIEPRPHPEYAYQALGNAEEDFGWLLGEYEHYCPAITAFEQATLAADSAGLPAASSLLNTGRCRYKLLSVFSQFDGCGRSADDEARRGLRDLQRAIDSGQLDDRATAEALSWQAKIHVLQSNYDEAEARHAQAIELTDINTTDGVTHHLDWAQIALAHARYLKRQRRPGEEVSAQLDAARERARVLADREQPLDPATRERVVRFLAACATESGDDRQALAEFQTALPEELADATSEHIRLLIGASKLISASPSLWPAHRALCDATAARAVELAAEAQETFLEADAWAARGMHATREHRLDPTRQTTARIRDYFERALKLEQRLDLTWYWRYLLASAYAEQARDSSAPAETRRKLSLQGIALLEPLSAGSVRYVPATVQARIDELISQLRTAAG